MTIEEISRLKKTFRTPTELWKRAFIEYNEFQIKTGGHGLSMNCASCWFKVLKFHEEKVYAN